jgi:hypothetical protein
VRCATWEQAASPKAALELGPSTPWLTIDDPQWGKNFGWQYWLADLNRDGRDDW